MRPTYRSLNKTLTLLGCERRLLICGMMCGAGLFFSFSSFTLGIATFLVFAVLGYFKAQDPVSLKLFFNPPKHNIYDAGKKLSFHVSIHDVHHD
jgi:hypothetical protein